MLQWAGPFGGAKLQGRVVVLSPHLDDAVFSVGAALAHAARHGADVLVITVLAGDPESSVPAGRWDGAAGYRTEGEAAAKRREEDARACARIGARTAWPTDGDGPYGPGAR